MVRNILKARMKELNLSVRINSIDGGDAIVSRDKKDDCFKVYLQFIKINDAHVGKNKASLNSQQVTLFLGMQNLKGRERKKSVHKQKEDTNKKKSNLTLIARFLIL